MPPENKITVFRIIQEQTTNILKHANASLASIQLTLNKNNLHLLIQDNGKGFDPCLQHSGVGLANIKNRADIYQGRVSLQTAPGKGCSLSVRFTLPLEAKASPGE